MVVLDTTKNGRGGSWVLDPWIRVARRASRVACRPMTPSSPPAYSTGHQRRSAALGSVELASWKDATERCGHLEELRIRWNDRTGSRPVVIFTASRQNEDVARGYALEANAHVRKPLDFAGSAEADQGARAFPAASERAGTRGAR